MTIIDIWPGKMCSWPLYKGNRQSFFKKSDNMETQIDKQFHRWKTNVLTVIECVTLQASCLLQNVLTFPTRCWGLKGDGGRLTPVYIVYCLVGPCSHTDWVVTVSHEVGHIVLELCWPFGNKQVFFRRWWSIYLKGRHKCVMIRNNLGPCI